MKKILLVGSFLSLASSAFAAWTINFDIDGLRKADGSSFIPASSLILLVADMGNNGYTAPIDNFSTALNASWGADDKVIARFSDTTNNIDGVFSVTVSGDSIYANKNFAMYWFSSLTLASNAVTGGTPYGTTSNIETNWAAPADSSTSNLTFLGQHNTGTLGDTGPFTDQQMTTSLTVSAVPEPATYAALFGLSVLGLAVYRRRRPVA